MGRRKDELWCSGSATHMSRSLKAHRIKELVFGVAKKYFLKENCNDCSGCLLNVYNQSAAVARGRYKTALSDNLNTPLLTSVYKRPFWVRYLATGLYLEILNCPTVLHDDNIFFISQLSCFVHLHWPTRIMSVNNCRYVHWQHS